MGVSNIKLGVCSINYDGSDLGLTKGGVTVAYEPKMTEIKVDKYGDSPVDYATNGESVKVKCKLAEVTIANLKSALPIGTQISTTGIELGSQAGALLSTSNGKKLVLHPLSKATSDHSEDWTFHKALVVSSIELNYEIDNQMVFEVEFEALIDETKTNGNLLGYFGTIS